MDGPKNVKQLKKNPLERANIISKLFFCWLLPFFAKGYKRELTEDDMYQHRKKHDSSKLGDILEAAWNKELQNRKDPSLLKVVAKVFYKECLILYILAITQEAVKLIQPVVLSKLLQLYDKNSTDKDMSDAYKYSAIIVFLNMIGIFLYYYFSMSILEVGIRIRVACCAMIYRKSLKLSKTALVETTVGQMVNLISNDVTRFDGFMLTLHQLVLGPIQIVVAMTLLYDNVGWTGLTGAIFLLVSIPIQSLLGKKTSQFRFAIAGRTDERVRLMNEIISGIQVIKMYTWEKPFSLLVKSARLKEMKYIKLASIIRAVLLSCTLVLNRTAVFLCIVVYVLTGNVLTASYAFTTASFYKLMNSVTQFFPAAVTQFAEVTISIRRIKKFLLYDEVDPEKFYRENGLGRITKEKIDQEEIHKMNMGINLKNVSAKWIKSLPENCVEKITLEAGANDLLAIVGPVGSGKTTLLHILLEELPPVEGSVIVSGKVSYASQEPWLFGATVRQNILFGQPFDGQKYREVVRVCALERDFALFSHGDGTLVGERGVTLSGGQRARINLARAVYKEADIYLLDDPLSAVDTHVGKHLFEECICGYLKNKCVVLVTHQLQFLKKVNKIILLGDGQIQVSGPYEVLKNSETNFKKLLTDIEEDEEESKHKGHDQDSEVDDNEIQRLAKEEKKSGDVSWHVYKSYLLASGHWYKAVLLSIVYLCSQSLDSISEYFVTFWVNLGQLRRNYEDSILAENASLSLETNATIFEILPFEAQRQWWWPIFTSDYTTLYYAILFMLIIVLTVSRSLAFYRWCLTAATKMHHAMFNNIVYSPMRFFNTNPSGRILNRFSKDIGVLDESLPSLLSDSIQIALAVLSIIFIIGSLNGWIIFPTVIMLVIFYGMRRVYLQSSRDIKRIESISRSPIFTHLTASLQGLTTIRAFKAQRVLEKEFENYQNSNSAAFFMALGANRTFAFWLDFICVIYVALVIIFLLFIKSESLGGNIGLALTQAISLTGLFQWGMRQWSELVNQMTSVERVQQYADLVPERDDQAKEPPKSWPEHGEIEFQNVYLSYSEDEPPVLKNLSFVIRPKEKVGIVGRTGAGKSSLIQALFRLTETEGHIFIDGVNTKSVALHKLRSKISIIPQEPVLFSGSLRKNLDPFDDYEDKALWSALEDVELKSAVIDLPAGLESKMAEGGSNFSVGQRQLFCLARAIIRNNRILVLDEATANVDPHTDALIQQTIRKKFRNCTVLTIAHRLHTIMDSDKVLVMDAGKAIECDHPHILLQDNSSVFRALVEQTGKSTAKSLKVTAEKAYNREQNTPTLQKK